MLCRHCPCLTYHYIQVSNFLRAVLITFSRLQTPSELHLYVAYSHRHAIPTFVPHNSAFCTVLHSTNSTHTHARLYSYDCARHVTLSSLFTVIIPLLLRLHDISPLLCPRALLGLTSLASPPPQIVEQMHKSTARPIDNKPRW